MDFETIYFETPEGLAEEAAAIWLGTLGSSERPLGIALSGGRIAKTFFEAITRLVRAKGINLKGVHFFWADERCVPSQDQHSNFRLAFDALLGPLDIHESNIHRIHGELEPTKAAVHAETELRMWARETGKSMDLPALDYIFLGMGEDGHVASLFPDGPTPAQVTGLFVPVIASKPPSRRISISYSMLANAREVIVLASGEGKENALRESVSSDGSTPLARVLQSRSHTRIFTDIRC